MNLQDAFQSIVDTDDAPVVITGLDHTIVYMNPAAQSRHAKRGGARSSAKPARVPQRKLGENYKRNDCVVLAGRAKQ